MTAALRRLLGGSDQAGIAPDRKKSGARKTPDDTERRLETVPQMTMAAFWENYKMKKHLMLATAAAVFALGAGAGLAQDKKQLVIVVKGLDNPFFEAINQGCQKWNSENADSEYECFYTGPASTSDEAGEAQIVQDLLSKSTTVAMAISPSNAKLIAQTLKTAAPTLPIMTLDADLAVEDSALRGAGGSRAECASDLAGFGSSGTRFRRATGANDSGPSPPAGRRRIGRGRIGRRLPRTERKAGHARPLTTRNDDWKRCRK